MIVINLYSGPCAGKSTLAADIFAKLKRAGVQAEIPPEVAKIRAQRGDFGFLQDQLAVFAETHHQLSMTARSGAEVAILDSPLLLSLIYAPKPYLASFPALVRDVYDQYQNLDFFIRRSSAHAYSTVGRIHDERQAQQIDSDILGLLSQHRIRHQFIDSSESSAQSVVACAMHEIEKLAAPVVAEHQRETAYA